MLASPLGWTVLLILTPPAEMARSADNTQSAAKEKLAVMPVEGQRIGADAVTILDALLVAELERTSSYEVIDFKDMNAMLGLERLKETLGCDDISCMTELGGALGTAALVRGQAIRLEDDLLLQLVLIDVERAEVRARGQSRVPNQESEYVRAVRMAVADLLGGDGERAGVTRSPLQIRFETTVPDHTFDVALVAGDGEVYRCSSLKFGDACSLNDLAMGEARYTITSPGLTGYKDDFHVGDENEVLVLSVQERVGSGNVIAWTFGGLGLGVGLAMASVGFALDVGGLVWGGIPTAVAGGVLIPVGFLFDYRIGVDETRLQLGEKPWWKFWSSVELVPYGAGISACGTF